MPFGGCACDYEGALLQQLGAYKAAPTASRIAGTQFVQEGHTAC